MKEVTSRAGSLMVIFDSVKELNDYADPKYLRTRGRAQFVGRDIGETWEELQAVQQAAWDEGIEVLTMSVERLRKEKIPELKDHRRQTQFSTDDGDEMDMERMMQGEAYWRKSVREDHEGPTIVTIITDTTTPASRDAEDILWRGAVAIALAILLEEKGYKVELWVANGSQLFDRESRAVITACCLKRPQDPLDISTLVNTVSGWFYRTATFTLLDTICAKHNKDVAFGYGTCREPQPADLDEISMDELRIYSSGVYSFSGAIQCIQAELARFHTKGSSTNEQ